VGYALVADRDQPRANAHSHPDSNAYADTDAHPDTNADTYTRSGSLH